MVNSLDPAFDALSHPIRRLIVERLAEGPTSVGDAAAGIDVSKPAITKHVRVLEASGVVRREVRGRTHMLSLDERPLTEASEWLERQRELWERKFDTVEDYLAEQRRQKK